MRERREEKNEKNGKKTGEAKLTLTVNTGRVSVEQQPREPKLTLTRGGSP